MTLIKKSSEKSSKKQCYQWSKKFEKRIYKYLDSEEIDISQPEIKKENYY